MPTARKLILAIVALLSSVLIACTARPAQTSARVADVGGSMVTVRLAIPVHGLPFATVYAAQRHGFYADHGLEVETLALGGQSPGSAGGGRDIRALLAGDVQFALTLGTAQLDNHQAGHSPLAVFNALDKNVVNVVMRADIAQRNSVTARSPIHEKLAALRGLRLAATWQGTFTYRQAEHMIRRAGYEPQRDVHLFGAGDGPSLIGAIESPPAPGWSPLADVLLHSPAIPEQVVVSGNGVMLIDNAAGEDPALAPFNFLTLFVTPDYAAENPDVVGRFVRASRAANEWILRANREQIADLVPLEAGGVSRGALVAGAASVQAATNRTGILDRQAVQHMLDMMSSGVGVDELHALSTDRFLIGP